MDLPKDAANLRNPELRVDGDITISSAEVFVYTT